MVLIDAVTVLVWIRGCKGQSFAAVRCLFRRTQCCTQLFQQQAWAYGRAAILRDTKPSPLHFPAPCCAGAATARCSDVYSNNEKQHATDKGGRGYKWASAVSGAADVCDALSLSPLTRPVRFHCGPFRCPLDQRA